MNESNITNTNPQEFLPTLPYGTPPEPIIKPAPRKSKKSVISGWELEKAVAPKKENFVLPGLLLGQVGLLCSPGGAGKSAVALILANQIAAGGKKDFLGFGEVEPGAACIITLEDPLEIFSSRQKEIKKDFSKSEYERINNNIHLVDATKQQNEMSFDFVVEAVKEALANRNSSPLRLLIIDHLSYWSSKDLDDKRECNKLIKEFGLIAKELGCAVLILHHTNRSSMTKSKDKPAPSSTIGGSYVLHSLARWVAILDHIDKKELKKSFKIDGEEENYKLLTVDKVNHGEKLKILLKRNSERSGLLYKLDFKSTAESDTKTSNIEPEIVTQEEAENFNMGEASPKLMTLDNDTHHIMNWLTRNPIFETVDKKRRRELTKLDPEGNKTDSDRPDPVYYNNVWSKGDTLQVTGPICDREDMKLYAFLVSTLVRSHKNGNKGLFLELSFKSILRSCDLKEGGESIKQLKRKLHRLNRMSLVFKDIHNRQWSGPLIMGMGFTGEGPERKARLIFNPFMIAFYRAEEYTLIDKTLLCSLNSDSTALFFFYTSHAFPVQNIKIQQLQEILGIPGTTEKKIVNRRITTAYKQLLTTGIFNREKTSLKGGLLHSTRSNSSTKKA